MQTLEFTRTLRQIVNELKVADLVDLLQKWLPQGAANSAVAQQDKDQFSSLLFNSHAGYDRLFRDNASANAILKHMNIQELYDPARMARMLNRVHSAPNIDNIRLNNSDIYDFFETLKVLQRVEATATALLETPKVSLEKPSDSILELELIDYDGQGIEPARLATAITILRSVYANLARLQGVSEDAPRFRYFDSGSDLIMAIEGTKAIVESLAATLLQWWDKRRFQRQDTYEKDVEALSKGLEFLTKVQESVEKGTITVEEAGNLKTRVFRGADQLIGLGLTLPLKEAGSVDQRQLLIEKRDVKLLGTGQPSDQEEEDDGRTEAPKVSG
jgi:hypothetical protein